MSYCFIQHGILPSEFKKISFKDKVVMIASLQNLAEQEEKRQKKSKAK